MLRKVLNRGRGRPARNVRRGSASAPAAGPTGTPATTQPTDPDATPAGPTAASPPAPAPSPAMKAALSTAGKVVAPATIVTALMYYFGWMYTRTFSLGLGIHPDLLGYSTQDYLLRSVDALFVPLVLLAAAIIALVWLHGRFVSRIASRTRSRGLNALLLATAIAGALLTVAAAVGALLPGGVRIAGYQFGYAAWAPRWAPPIGIVLGAAVADYAIGLRRQLHRAEGDPGARVLQPPGPGMTWERSAQRVALGGLMLLGLFWAVHIYALDVGHVRIWSLGQDPDAWQELPHVVLYSSEDLLLDAPGVTVGDCSAHGGAYRYRYTGLRLFTYANDRYFLLPTDWPDTQGAAIVLADAPAVRFDLLPGGQRPDPAGDCVLRDTSRWRPRTAASTEASAARSSPA